MSGQNQINDKLEIVPFRHKVLPELISKTCHIKKFLDSEFIFDTNFEIIKESESWIIRDKRMK